MAYGRAVLAENNGQSTKKWKHHRRLQHNQSPMVLNCSQLVLPQSWRTAASTGCKHTHLSPALNLDLEQPHQTEAIFLLLTTEEQDVLHSDTSPWLWGRGNNLYIATTHIRRICKWQKKLPKELNFHLDLKFYSTYSLFSCVQMPALEPLNILLKLFYIEYQEK